MRPLVLKLGGELVETPADRAAIARLAASITQDRPLVLVHGGGKAIDAALDRRGITPKKVEGLRVTDDDTLDVVVEVLGGSTNTALVAALAGHGVPAVGLTGADAGLGRATRVSAHRTTSGAVVDLGRVGDPVDADPALLALLTRHGYVPVIASIGLEDGVPSGARALLNVNADVMACRIAAAIAGSDLVIAGTTPGVLDAAGRTIAAMDIDAMDQAIAGGTATAGMIAKLSACRAALTQGVASVRLIDGRGLESAEALAAAPGTLLERTRVVA
jgi:acetylglutamate kinase